LEAGEAGKIFLGIMESSVNNDLSC